ncbi:MAG: PE repeat family protein [candidate division CPR1 bacterium GW2011_GWA2_42_17]|uniref:PE repeat family protein n=1 Tax=candidate division CPR1 bacterium GW2011_GWA2_42_17 TaxID=1618341 RepID=A0A0G1BCR6_9BACT|nr:MAG: PE repeat family protein [candidate division CPR1 bacterium GW2011_GWA2_42_17]
MREETDAPTRRHPKEDATRSVQARRTAGDDDIRRQPPARTTQVTAAFGMKDFIEWAIEAFGEPAKVLTSQRFALDKIMQRERGAKTPADVLKSVMQVIGDKGREQAGKSFGSYYGVANGNLEGILEFFFTIRAMPDWQKKMQASSSKLTEAESALMVTLAEGDDELVVPEGATIKTCALLKKTMQKLGLRGDEGINRARMIISRAAQVREQQQAFAKTQVAIATVREVAAYKKLLADGSYAEAVKVLTSAGATGSEAREMAKADLKAIAMAIVDDEECETLVMMIPEDVLPSDEAVQWAEERAQAQKTAKKAEKAKEPVKEKPAKAKKAKKAPVDPAPAPVPVVEEKPAEIVVAPIVVAAPPPDSMPEEMPAKVEEPAPIAPVAPVDDITAQLMSARRKVLLALSKKELRKRCAELEIAVPPEILAAKGDQVEKAKEWLANQIIAKEFVATSAA